MLSCTPSDQLGGPFVPEDAKKAHQGAHTSFGVFDGGYVTFQFEAEQQRVIHRAAVEYGLNRASIEVTHKKNLAVSDAGEPLSVIRVPAEAAVVAKPLQVSSVEIQLCRVSIVTVTHWNLG